MSAHSATRRRVAAATAWSVPVIAVASTAPRVCSPARPAGAGEGSGVKAHDMSAYWRLVSNEGGLVTGTWWVTRPNNKGSQHVKPIDVVMWNEGRHAGASLHSDDFTAFIRDGVIEPINVRARRDFVTYEANSRSDEIEAAVLELDVRALPDWIGGEA